MPMLLLFVLLALIAIINLIDPTSGGLGGWLEIGGRPVTWVMTLGLFGAQLVCAGYIIKGCWDGVFMDKDGAISLARFQLILWTALLISALISAGLSNAALGHDKPLEIDIPPTVWSLLGLSSVTFVSALLITYRKKQLHLVTSAAGDWRNLIRADQGDFVDIGKLQKLAFTMMLITIYAMGLYDTMAEMEGGDPAKIDGFPAVDDGFVALVGLSHTAYLVIKAAPIWTRRRPDRGES